MLRLIEGGFGTGLHEEIIKGITTALKSGRRAVLIVPEQQTVSAEGELASLLVGRESLFAEATNFTRFADSCFRAIGGSGGSYATAATDALVMWRTLTELSSVLKITAGGNVQQGSVQKALGAVKEMQGLGIMPNDLAKATENVKEPRLRDKLSDLALIYSAYKGTLGDKFKSVTDDLISLADRLKSNKDYLSDTDIFLEGFTSFTEPQYLLIKELLSRCSVTVALPLPRAERDAFEYSEPRATEERLLRIADIAQVRKERERLTEQNGDTLPLCTQLSRVLWRANSSIDNSYLQNPCISIYEAHTPFDECDFIAADIKRRVMGGASFSDIAIIARKAESYDGILDTALSRAGVPHFVSKRRDVTSFEAIRLILTAYEVIGRGFKSEDVLSYAKCGLLDVSADACDEFELYVERWGITGKRFTQDELWNMNPRGYTSYSEGDSEKLIRINNTKALILNPLLSFKAALSNASTVREQATVLVSFLLDIKLESKIAKRCERLKSLGEEEAAEENSRLWQIICDALDLLENILGDVRASADTFATLLSVVFSQQTVGRIPAHKDEVTVGSADMIRLRGKKHIYLMGVNAGEFPASSTEGSYFTDRDRLTLKDAGLTLESTQEKAAARELFIFNRALCSGSESATLLYARSTAGGAETRPAEAIEKIIKLCKKTVSVKKIAALPARDKIFSAEAALYRSEGLSDLERAELSLALTEAGYKEELKISEGYVKNDTLKLSSEGSAYLFGGDLYLSQTRIDTFLRCPMNYFCEYCLKLDDGEAAEMGVNVIGSFVHSILENFFSELKKRGTLIKDLSESEKDSLVESAARVFISEVFSGNASSERAKVAINRLTRAARPIVDGLCQEFCNCLFTPVFFELKTDAKNQALPNPVVFNTNDGKRAIINGTVDRVDCYVKDGDVYVRVVDYKTGAKDFSPEDMAKGQNLQMFLYLKAITDTDKPEFRKALGAENEGARLIPAGVIYAKTAVKDVLIQKPDDELARQAVLDIQGREGMLLDDSDSIAAMNPSFIPIKLKDGEVEAKSKKYLYNADGWQQISETIRDVILNVCDSIKGGNINAQNTDEKGESNCGYCGYRAVCRSYKPKTYYN